MANHPVPPFRPDLSLVPRLYQKPVTGYQGRYGPPEPVPDLRPPLVLDEIVKGEHTPDWGFYGPDGICKPSPVLHKFYIWTCRCGKYVGSCTRDDSWTKFMIHKYGDEWTEKAKFDKLWGECFPPSPKVTSFIRRVLISLLRLPTACWAGVKVIPPRVLILSFLYLMFVLSIVLKLSFR